MRRPLMLALLAITLTAGPLARSSAAETTTLPAELQAHADAGIAVELLASLVVDPLPTEATLRLSRVTPATLAAMPSLLSGGSELWFVESGEATLTGDDGAVTVIPEGGTGVVPAAGLVTVALSGGDCPSALRLEVVPVYAMQVTSDVAGPALGEAAAACPAGGVLLDAAASVAPPSGPGYAFLAREVWPGYAGASLTGSGLLGVSVAEGMLAVGNAGVLALQFGPGGWAVVEAGQTAALFVPSDQPMTLLIAGFVTAPPA